MSCSLKDRIEGLRARMRFFTLAAGCCGLFLPAAPLEAGMPGWIWPAWAIYACACYVHRDMDKSVELLGGRKGPWSLVNSLLFCMVSAFAAGMQIISYSALAQSGL